MQQDELAALFQQSLNFQTPAAIAEPILEHHVEQQQQTREQRPQQEQGQNIDLDQQSPQQEQDQHQEYRQPIIYASTHYTPNTHHLISRPASAPNLNSPTTVNSPFSPPTTTSPTVLLPSARTNPHLLAIFARNSIDIADLSPGQLELFTSADSDQQLRLLELWRITLRGAAAEDGVWTSATSLEMEEALARERWERIQHQHHHHSQQPQHIQVDTMVDVMTDDDGTTTSDASASPTSLASPTLRGGVNNSSSLPHAEPYMLSGYEQLAKRDYEAQSTNQQQQQQQQQQPHHRQGVIYGYNTPSSSSTDPVYKATVENQYGAFQAMREYGYESTGGGWGDDDMVM